MDIYKCPKIDSGLSSWGKNSVFFFKYVPEYIYFLICGEGCVKKSLMKKTFIISIFYFILAFTK